MSRTSNSRSRGERRPHLEALEDRAVPASLAIGFSEAALLTGLSNPTTMEIALDGKLFILEQAGTARVYDGGTLLNANFFVGSTLTPDTVDDDGERGLLGIAFDPDYATNRYLYVYYTADGGSSASHNRVSRFTANAAGDQVVPTSEEIVLELPNLSATNHNGGAIHFGTDGKLYVAVGDNADAARAQSLGNVFGKILRVNADGSTPGDNPFVGTPGADGRVWALGFRNPYTFDVDAAGTIFVNDVGGGSWEEIDELVKGANYGWPTTEGPFDPSAFPNFTNPIFAYPHPGVAPAAFTGRAITGGTFYEPSTVLFPTDYGPGGYFFADFVSGFIKRFDPSTGRVRDFAAGIQGPVDLDVTGDGRLLYLAYLEGAVYSVTFTVPASGLLPDGSVGTASQRLVAAEYRDVLGRDISVAEINAGVLDFWAGYLDQFGLKSFSLAIQSSTEARLRLIEGRYQDYLGRSADAAGRDGWLAFLRGGATIEEFELGVLSSPEYRALHGNNFADLVEGWYGDVLGRASDPDGKAGFVDALQSGRMSIAQALSMFLTSREYRERVVKDYYLDYLGRQADAPGLKSWADGLASGLRDEEVLAMILGDPGGEYFNRSVF